MLRGKISLNPIQWSCDDGDGSYSFSFTDRLAELRDEHEPCVLCHRRIYSLVRSRWSGAVRIQETAEPLVGRRQAHFTWSRSSVEVSQQLFLKPV